MEHTVEIVLAPVVDGHWRKLRDAVDTIPGTILLEDSEEPMLIIPVDASSPRTAAIFVQGVMTVLGLDIQWGRSYRTEPSDLDFEPEGSEGATVPGFAPRWLEDEVQTRKALDFALA